MIILCTLVHRMHEKGCMKKLRFPSRPDSTKTRVLGFWWIWMDDCLVTTWSGKVQKGQEFHKKNCETYVAQVTKTLCGPHLRRHKNDERNLFHFVPR